MEEKPIKSMAEFLAIALDGATGEGAICVHVRGSLVLLTESRLAGSYDDSRYQHKLASWHVEEADEPDEERRKDLRFEIEKVKALITGPEKTPTNEEARRQLKELWIQLCAIEGCEYAMIYNEGTTCMNCDQHLQMFGSPDGKTLSPAPNKIDRAFVLRLYAVHERVMAAATDLNTAVASLGVLGYLGVQADVVECANKLDYETDQLEQIFSEVLTDAERGVPTDEEFARQIGALKVSDFKAPVPMGENLSDEEYKRQLDHYSRSDFIAGRPKIVCLCGSTRFMEAFQEANLRETMEGHIVLSVGCNTKSDAELVLEKHGGQLGALKQRLDDLHKRKIDLADEILVLNVGGYIGASTRSEIAYAQVQGKAIRYLERMEPEHFFEEAKNGS